MLKCVLKYRDYQYFFLFVILLLVISDSLLFLFQTTRRTVPFLFVRGDGVILVSPPLRTAWLRLLGLRPLMRKLLLLAYVFPVSSNSIVCYVAVFPSNVIQLNVNLYRNPRGILFWCTLEQFFSVWWLHAGIFDVSWRSSKPLSWVNCYVTPDLQCFRSWFLNQWGMVLLYHWLLQLTIDKLRDLWPSDVCYICRHQFVSIRATYAAWWSDKWFDRLHSSRMDYGSNVFENGRS